MPTPCVLIKHLVNFRTALDPVLCDNLEGWGGEGGGWGVQEGRDPCVPMADSC